MDEILNYNGNTNKWLNAGKMTTPRDSYSVVLLTDTSKICGEIGEMTFYLRLLGLMLSRIFRYKGKEKQPDWNCCELGANIPSCC